MYLGERIDPATHQRTGERVDLDPAALTTHGLVVGMTGSGKTGLGVVMIEEALLAGIPVLVIDPKGDLPNIALTFPDLRPEDFAPWLDAGTDAAAVAQQWKDGLASWGLGHDQIAALKAAAPVTVYTPGSAAGVPIDVVGSLRRPPEGTDDETVADEVEGYVSGLLGMIGIDADPLSSKEHILLSNLIHNAWATGTDLDVPALVSQVQQPPIRKLGVLDLDSFFPADDRTVLAVRLNGLLASPSFAAWAAGTTLDMDALLHGCSIVSLGHLGDEERQFVVSLVLGKLVTWMRRQPGTDKLRVLVWFDEVMGFVPPTAAPPAKKPILTLLKQARAFGVGVVLATQNPVDVDYKGIANAGTWAVGRLQTEQDKARLLDGMTSAAGGVDVGAIGAQISGLAKREFVLRRPGANETIPLTTRWTLSYLRGPMTRDQLAQLRAATPQPAAPSAPAQPAAATAAGAAPAVAADETTVMPAVAGDVPVRWVDPAAPWLLQLGPNTGRYVPALAVRLELLYDDDKLDLREAQEFEAVVHPTEPMTVVAVDHDDRDFLAVAPAGARYVLGGAAFDAAKLQKAVVDQLVASRTMQVPVNRALKLAGRPGEDPAAFAARCDAAADAAADTKAAALRQKYEARFGRANDQVAAAADRVEQAEAARSTRRSSELLEGAGALLGGLLGGRRNARSLARAASGAVTRHNRSGEAATRVESAQNRLQEKQDAVADLEAELAQELSELGQEWDEKAVAIETVEVRLERTDVRVVAACVLWLPLG